MDPKTSRIINGQLYADMATICDICKTIPCEHFMVDGANILVSDDAKGLFYTKKEGK